jgi:hypothetical protein
VKSLIVGIFLSLAAELWIDLEGKDRTERTFIRVVCSNTIGAGSLIGGTLAADFECSEFGRIFAPSAGFIVFSINAKALYEGHVEILCIVQVVGTIRECIFRIFTGEVKLMLSLEMRLETWLIMRRDSS